MNPLRLALTLMIATALLADCAHSQSVWTVQQSGTTEPFHSVAYANGAFLATCGGGFLEFGGKVLRSTDGAKWEQMTWVGEDRARRVFSNGHGFLILEERRILLSDDGVSGEDAGAGDWKFFGGSGHAAWKGGVWVLAGAIPKDSPGGGQGLVLRLAGGELRPASLLPGTGNIAWVVATDTEFLLQIGAAIFASPDGDRWSLRYRGTASRPIVVGNTLYSNGEVSSDAGATWNSVKVEGAGQSVPVVYGGGAFLALAPSSVYSSRDFQKWTAHETGTTNHLTVAAFGGGLFVAAGEAGRIVTSPLDDTPAPGVLTPLEIFPSVTLRWQSADGRTYRIERSADLTHWEAIGLPISGTGGHMERTELITGPKRYFRVLEADQ